MKTDLIKLLIIDTKLIDNSLLSEAEQSSIIALLKDNKNYLEIGKEFNLSNERVRQIVENGMGKVLLTVKELIAKSKLIPSLVAENKMVKSQLKEIRVKLKNQLENEALNIKVKYVNIPIDEIRFSVRAQTALTILIIKSTGDLKNLTRQKLNSTPSIGMKPIEEIIRVAEEYGIQIN